jgi:hypothetical protein
MTMTPASTDITRALKWLQNNAPNIQSLINSKSDWYDQFHNNFWTQWETNVFDLETANSFGLMVWCIILGVPAQLFGLYPENNAWAYGAQRQNYKYSGSVPTLPNPNLVGGNFYGGGNTTLINIAEVRLALRLRYAALVSNGRLQFINYMLRWIFNNDQPWDFPGKRYFYVVDSTAPAQTLTPTPPVTTPHLMEYRVGANMGLSAQFINLLNSPQYGIVPSCAGTRYTVIQET